MTKILHLWLVTLLFVWPSWVMAQQPPLPDCKSLPGCGGAPANLVEKAIPIIGEIMLGLAGGMGVLFIIWAGLQMVMSRGDDSKYSSAKAGVINAMLGVGLAVTSQLIVSFVATGSGLEGVQDEYGLLSYAGESIVTLLNGLLLLYIIYGGVIMVMAHGKEDEVTKGRTAITHAAIGAIVVNTAHALVQAVTGYFGG